MHHFDNSADIKMEKINYEFQTTLNHHHRPNVIFRPKMALRYLISKNKNKNKE